MKKPLYVLVGKYARTHIHADGLQPRPRHIHKLNTTLCGLSHNGRTLHFAFTDICQSCKKYAWKLGYAV